MKTKWLLTAAMTAMLAAPMAMAQDGPPPEGDKPPHHGKMLEKIDTDGDGKVSKAEFMAAHEERFKNADADGDGYLTPDEMKAAWEKMHDGMKDRREMRREHRGDMKPGDDAPGGEPPAGEEGGAE